jgi:hypothetical protein
LRDKRRKQEENADRDFSHDSHSCGGLQPHLTTRDKLDSHYVQHSSGQARRRDNASALAERMPTALSISTHAGE